MGKTITAILIGAITAAPGLISAQSHHSNNGFTSYRGHNALHKPMGLMSHPKYAAKTTATDVRLVAVGDMEYNGAAYVQTDSFTLNYTGTRGGVFDDQWIGWNWKLDQAFGYMYNTSTSAYDPAGMKMSFSYDASDNITTQLEQEWNTTTSAWDNVRNAVNTYSTTNNHLTETDQDWNSTTSAWDNQYRITYTYTTANKVATSLQEDWNTTSGAWDNFVMEFYTWDASGNLVKDSANFWSGSGWQTGYRSSYTYDASGNRTIQLREFWDGTSAWDTSEKVVNSGFVAYHQPQTTIFMDWNPTTHTFENTAKDNYTYNTYGKPDYYFGENWNATTSTWAPDTFSTATRYHYQTYTTGIANIAEQGVSAKVFPVPAMNNLSIDAAWDEAQPFTVSVTDMCGKTFTTWSVPAKKQYTETFSVSELPTGNYILTLQGDHGRISKQFTVIR